MIDSSFYVICKHSFKAQLNFISLKRIKAFFLLFLSSNVIHRTLIFWRIWSEVDSSIACLISYCTWEIFADVRTTFKFLSESMYVTVTSKDVVECMTMLYCCNCFSFLTEEKCWSTKTELNDRSSVAVYDFLIFSDVIVSCRVS